jgi:hypothetical protein
VGPNDRVLIAGRAKVVKITGYGSIKSNKNPVQSHFERDIDLK